MADNPVYLCHNCPEYYSPSSNTGNQLCATCAEQLGGRWQRCSGGQEQGIDSRLGEGDGIDQLEQARQKRETEQVGPRQGSFALDAKYEPMGYPFMPPGDYPVQNPVGYPAQPPMQWQPPIQQQPPMQWQPLATSPPPTATPILLVPSPAPHSRTCCWCCLALMLLILLALLSTILALMSSCLFWGYQSCSYPYISDTLCCSSIYSYTGCPPQSKILQQCRTVQQVQARNSGWRIGMMVAVGVCAAAFVGSLWRWVVVNWRNRNRGHYVRL